MDTPGPAHGRLAVVRRDARGGQRRHRNRTTPPRHRRAAAPPVAALLARLLSHRNLIAPVAVTGAARSGRSAGARPSRPRRARLAGASLSRSRPSATARRSPAPGATT
jgi:hypothetical protein